MPKSCSGHFRELNRVGNRAIYIVPFAPRSSLFRSVIKFSTFFVPLLFTRIPPSENRWKKIPGDPFFSTKTERNTHTHTFPYLFSFFEGRGFFFLSLAEKTIHLLCGGPWHWWRKKKRGGTADHLPHMQVRIIAHDSWYLFLTCLIWREIRASVSPTQAIKPRPPAARPKVRIGRQRQVYFYDVEEGEGQMQPFPRKM